MLQVESRQGHITNFILKMIGDAGCGDLTYNITTGLSNVNGARYVLNLGFKTGAAVLLNETETSVRDQ